jgi:hypothetical protein
VEWSWVSDHIWNIFRYGVQWDEAVAQQVKVELRYGEHTRTMDGMRQWLDRWEVEAQKELDRRAAAQEPISKVRLLSTAWWTGVDGERGEEETASACDECEGGGFDLSLLCIEAASYG